jgi:hypothetical protein
MVDSTVTTRATVLNPNRTVLSAHITTAGRGLPVATYGITTRARVGQIRDTGVHWATTGSRNMATATFISNLGDSGGPVFTSSSAVANNVGVVLGDFGPNTDTVLALTRDILNAHGLQLY